jgi:hypothetical protein
MLDHQADSDYIRADEGAAMSPRQNAAADCRFDGLDIRSRIAPTH